MDKPFNIPNVCQSLIIRLEANAIKMREAREEACRCGMWNYVPSAMQLMKRLREYEKSFPFPHEQFARFITKH